MTAGGYPTSSSSKYGALLVLVGSIVLAVLTTVAIVALDRKADTSRQLSAKLTDVEAEVRHISALEWQAMAERGTITAAVQEMEETESQLLATLSKLNVNHHGSRDVAEFSLVFADYCAAVDEEIRLLEAGQFDQARELDEQKVDLKFKQVIEALRKARRNAEHLGQQALRRTQIWLFLIVFGSVVAFVCLSWQHQRIRERYRIQESIRESEEKLRLLLESTAEGIYGIDLQNCCTLCNPACLRLLGYQHPDQLLGQNMHHLIHHSRRDGTPLAESDCRIVGAFKRGQGIHVDDEVLWKADGSSIPIEYWSYPQTKDGKLVGAVVTFIDITERKEAEEKVKALAFYDALTGLPNRILLQDRLGKALARARRHRERVAVLFLDLDGFKVINDSLGHSVGDILLKKVAERLQSCARDQDTISRLGGDEFVVLLTSVKEVSDVAVASDRILKSLSAGFVVLEHSLNLSCSIGVSLFPEHAMDGETLIKHADAAMYRAKDRGRNNVQFFTHDMNAEVIERMTLESSLRRAQERNELYLMYQPQFDIETGNIVGTEALLRWQHPELGLVPPDKFIPIAENSGLITSIGEWVLRTACSQAKQWERDGFPPVPVAVNVSAVQFRQEGFVELVRSVLVDTGLSPQFLELEITESLLMSSADVIPSVLRELHKMGVKLSIDDFGTGYSSLSYLKHFPVYKLKIDRSFVRDVTVDPDDAAITGTIISMAKSLGMKVIAEGVEQREQVVFLRSHECNEAQGFFFSKPVLPADLAGLRTKYLTDKNGSLSVHS